MKCGLINILLIAVLFLRCGSHNKVIFSAGKIVPSLYNFMLELNTSVIHGSKGHHGFEMFGHPNMFGKPLLRKIV